MAAQMVQLNLAVELAEDQLKHKEAEATYASSTQQQSAKLLLAEQRKYSLLNQEFEVPCVSELFSSLELSVSFSQC